MSFPLKQIVVKTRKMVRIKCPYCPTGGGFFHYTMTNFGEVEGSAADPIKCAVCEKYFKIKPQIVFKGVPLEEKKEKGMVIA